MEKPNLTFIHQLSGNDLEFEKELLMVIKTEFPKEKKEYFSAIKEKNFKKTEDSVHKLKHKISILGLKNSYKLADEYESGLREKDNALQPRFNAVLATIEQYLENF
jgi:HPt (histidine-containing phosphotransfer) domain-containing protein